MKDEKRGKVCTSSNTWSCVEDRCPTTALMSSSVCWLRGGRSGTVNEVEGTFGWRSSDSSVNSTSLKTTASFTRVSLLVLKVSCRHCVALLAFTPRESFVPGGMSPAREEPAGPEEEPEAAEEAEPAAPPPLAPPLPVPGAPDEPSCALFFSRPRSSVSSSCDQARAGVHESKTKKKKRRSARTSE